MDAANMVRVYGALADTIATKWPFAKRDLKRLDKPSPRDCFTQVYL
jgi:hypothetical protein